MLSFAVVIISYLLGSISFSIVAARLLKGIDIRQHGSGNAGATNTLRVLGKGPGITVFVLDILKGVAAVLLGRWLVPDSEWVPALCGLAAIVGHNWPVYFRFKGGKGIATMVGIMLTLAFLPGLYAGIAAIAVIALTRYVSLGSLVFSVLAPAFILMMNLSLPLFWISLILCAFAFIRHRTNIVKLVQGRENKLGAKKGA
ncbi:glycerol-3-phosphate 1-O-acyltransferase PlsY [Paenibacillus beijingensis]|uniref:Glycerol-3-phosphate acyltransferase n=1 Tax=Paenibacillus beijingensis TaxID=1126833 RepID=A0A0D5NQD1_9BACL|nr:glycerol-3-phosphate 1-O-acyltransferase PlsY [Paenibacillus beijingensis]AJY77187.1 hypothetical protein VN24_24825 [Paenibacillus beijingensis]